MYQKIKNLFDIKVIYTIIFITLASWSFFAYYTMSTLIKEQKVYANIINLSGKQRMLSQKTALMAERFYESNNKNFKIHFYELITLMEKEHKYITNNLNTKESQNIYFKKPYNLDKKVTTYISMLKEFYKNKQKETLEKIHDYSFNLLPKLNHAVYQFEKESQDMTQNLLERELFILIGTLFTLFLEAIFIVIPSIKLTQEKEKELQELNSVLAHKIENAIKENRKKENMLKHHFRLAQMGEIIKNIAHHWRQPLSVISTLASSMKIEKQLNILEDKRLIQNLDTIVDYTQDLSKVIENFTLFTDDSHDLIYFNVTKCMYLTTNLIDATLKHENIKLIKNYDNKELRIEGNNIKFRQLLLNILNNAKDALVKSTNKDKYIKISLEEKADSIKILIENNGDKIKENILPKIFDIYFTTKHSSKGTGLGLFLSYEIATKHFKGDLSAKNLTNGVLFEINLPKFSNTSKTL
ncbi:sensor histidine kinase [Malaciobacter sp. WC5094]|uniref:sensor histidine kinase n=1 Tax=Arcobacter sp. YIC-80 TaxID=3376683 RepID=UPI00385132C7